jgi:predicted nucleotidyltransferase
MAIADILRVFRDLKQERTVRDYLVFGSVAAMVHTRPFFTRDVDIGVAIESDEEFRRIFNRLADFGKVEGHSVVIHGTPVEIFPVDISPIIQDALIHANRKRVENVVVKVASPEHLLLESLRVYRSQDKGRVFLLDEVVDRQKLHTLLGRLDYDGTLGQRYQSLTGKSP